MSPNTALAAEATATIVQGTDEGPSTPRTSPTNNFIPVGDQPLSYRGLSNQGATCYLNSLLQSLFMTPEFRTALYRWDYDSAKDGPKEHCIPYQLQVLFGLMQTSALDACSTEPLTKSFGWGNAEAFQQQDVQELCRVLFDCLELTFRGTPNEDLVNRLYQGKSSSWIKTIGYEFESNTPAHFLDIILQIHVFGSDKVLNSVRESIEWSFTPEKLDGDNQYYCEEAKAKFDAIKGFNYDSLPYILTVQLMRFSLDPRTLARIKLNDEVRFPFVLNMNPYVGTSGAALAEKLGRKEVKEEGMAMDVDDLPDLVDAAGNKAPDQLEEEKRESYFEEDVELDAFELIREEGEWVYELYAVLVHSGSALGGHYYAYIKNMDTGGWFNFNDSRVTPIDKATVKTAWGGHKSAYGNKSYGANAYMLMYRKVDPKRNSPLPTNDLVPASVKQELSRIEEEERKREEERRRLANLITLYCYHDAGELELLKIDKYASLWELCVEMGKIFSFVVVRTREEARQASERDGEEADDEGVDGGVKTVCVEDVRVSKYHFSHKLATSSYDMSKLDTSLQSLNILTATRLVLEIKQPHQTFPAPIDDPVVLKYSYLIRQATGSDDEESNGDESEGRESKRRRRDLLGHDRLSKAEPVVVSRDITVRGLRELIGSRAGIDPASCRLLTIQGSGVSALQARDLLNEQRDGDDDDDGAVMPFRSSRLYEGQVVYAEEGRSPSDDEASRCVEAYSRSIHETTIYLSSLGGKIADTPLLVDKRWTTQMLHDEIKLKLELTEPFKMIKYYEAGMELKLSEKNTISMCSPSFKVFVKRGAPLCDGMFSIKCHRYYPMQTLPVSHYSQRSTAENEAEDDGESSWDPCVPSPAVLAEQSVGADLVAACSVKPAKPVDFEEARAMPQATSMVFDEPLVIDVKQDMLVDALRAQIFDKLKEFGMVTDGATPEHIRLREKLGSQTARILKDGRTLKESSSSPLYDGKTLGFEVREIPESLHEIAPAVQFLIRRWHRSSWSLGPCHEVFFTTPASSKSIQEVLCEYHHIKPDDLRVMSVSRSSSLRLCQLQLCLDGKSYMGHWMNLDKESPHSFQDGEYLLITDVSESLVELDEEMQAIAEGRAPPAARPLAPVRVPSYDDSSSGMATSVNPLHSSANGVDLAASKDDSYASYNIAYNNNTNTTSNTITAMPYKPRRETGIVIKTRHAPVVPSTEQQGETEAIEVDEAVWTDRDPSPKDTEPASRTDFDAFV